MDLIGIAKRAKMPANRLDRIITGDIRPSLRLAKKLERITGIRTEAWLSPEEYFLEKQFYNADDPPPDRWRKGYRHV